MGVFLCGQSFLSTYAGAMPFFPCVGDLFFCYGGGGGALLGLPPHNNFCGSLLSQKFFQIVEGLIFLRELFDPPKNLPPRPSTNLNK